MAHILLAIGGLTLLACEPPLAGDAPPGEGPEIAFAEISVGQGTACGLDVEGKTYCWGRWAGPDTTLPVPIATDERFRSLAVGLSTRCALTVAGEAWCWGGSSGGQLGNGGAPHEPWELMEVSGGHTFTAMAQGVAFHRCAIRDDQTAWCWGWNDTGQLGHGGTVESESTPVQVGLGALMGRELLLTEIAVAAEHSCGLRPNGTAVCWGGNTTGQLGNGTTSASSVPILVAGDHVFTAITTGGVQGGFGLSCALDPEGRAYCWGDNRLGALGDGTMESRLIPTPVASAARFVRISASGTTVCALTAEGDAYCWGSSMNAGGADVTARTLVPTLITGGHHFTRIATGNIVTCAVTIDTDAYCWGISNAGLLGNGQRDFRSAEPQKVLPPAGE